MYKYKKPEHFVIITFCNNLISLFKTKVLETVISLEDVYFYEYAF